MSFEPDREGYNDIMHAYEEQVGEYIIETATRMHLKKIEAYMVLDVIMQIMKEDIKKEKR